MKCCPDCGKVTKPLNVPAELVTYETYASLFQCVDCFKVWVEETGDNAQGIYLSEQQACNGEECAICGGEPQNMNDDIWGCSKCGAEWWKEE